jgi:lipopolysaccharide transport system permease protein
MIMDVILMAGFFMTPVFYSLDILPHSYMLFGVNLDIWRLTYYFNPMASIIANYRVIIFDGAPPATDFFVRTLLTAFVFLLIGLAIFYRYQGRFSEEV